MELKVKIYGILFMFFVGTFSFANVNQKFANPLNCAGCHKEQVQDWKTTWHSHAHEGKNPLFKKVVTFVKKATHKTRADVLTHCAKCHNPKLQISKVDDSYLYAKAFGIETQGTKKVDEALVATHTKTGISCFICHNIDKLDKKTNPKEGGLDIVHWTKGDLIVGPFTSNNRAGFHQTQQREHFIKGNELCLTCHQGSGNYNNLDGYQTGQELASDSPRCVECHMSSSKKGVIAPHITRAGELPVVRDIRSHLFAGARNSDILNTTLSLFIQPKANEIDFFIKNLSPHKTPTGFSGRALELEFLFYNKKELIGKQKIELKATYVDSRGKETISYVASSLKSDTRLNANELRNITLQRPKNATSVTVNAWYYLVSPSLQKILEVDDELFIKKYKVSSSSLKL